MTIAGWTMPHTERWTVGDDLAYCRLFLHDPDELLITQAELLEAYQDGYRQLCAQAQSTRQWRVLDMPPRATISYVYDWESQFTFGGTSRQIGYRTSNGKHCMYAWEVEQAEGLPVTDGAAVYCTQLWEYSYLPDSSGTDQYFTFAVDRSQERIARVYWDHKALVPRAVSEIDAHTTAWWREGNEPWAWTRGTGGLRHFDIYPLHTEYQQGYDLLANPATATGGISGSPLGLVRELSGERSYDWSSDDSTAPLGLVRAVSSPDRQYLAQPTWSPPLGVVRDWHSSVATLLLWEIVLPDVPRLAEEDTPFLLPAPLQKYLRAYVLFKAFARQGELQRLELSAYFEQRWLRGIVIMKRLGFVTRRDRTYQRQGVLRRHSVPRPRLPPEFARY